MKNKRKYLEAYFTVEASYLLPISIIITCFTIIYIFFLYNSVVIYQACYISSLRGSQMMDASKGQIEESVNRFASELLENQIYDYSVNVEVEVGLLSIKTGAESEMENVLNTFDVVADEEMNIKSKAEALRIDPVTILRLKNR